MRSDIILLATASALAATTIAAPLGAPESTGTTDVYLGARSDAVAEEQTVVRRGMSIFARALKGETAEKGVEEDVSQEEEGTKPLKKATKVEPKKKHPLAAKLAAAKAKIVKPKAAAVDAEEVDEADKVKKVTPKGKKEAAAVHHPVASAKFAPHHPHLHVAAVTTEKGAKPKTAKAAVPVPAKGPKAAPKEEKDEGADLAERDVEDSAPFLSERDLEEYVVPYLSERDLEALYADIDERDYDDLYERDFEDFELEDRDFDDEELELNERDFEDEELELMERDFDEFELDDRDFDEDSELNERNFEDSYEDLD